MKNQKLKTTLTAVMIITLVTTLAMCLVHLITESGLGAGNFGYLYKIEWGTDTELAPKLVMNWDYAGIFAALLFVAFISWVVRTCMFTVPTIREGGSNTTAKLICEVLVGVGLILAIIALFIPLEGKITLTGEATDLIDADSIIDASGVMAWLALPMAAISGITSVCLNKTK